jgi:hypothetical protein
MSAIHKRASVGIIKRTSEQSVASVQDVTLTLSEHDGFDMGNHLAAFGTVVALRACLISSLMSLKVVHGLDLCMCDSLLVYVSRMCPVAEILHNVIAVTSARPTRGMTCNVGTSRVLSAALFPLLTNRTRGYMSTDISWSRSVELTKFLKTSLASSPDSMTGHSHAAYTQRTNK